VSKDKADNETARDTVNDGAAPVSDAADLYRGGTRELVWADDGIWTRERG